jgi:hypothetical protein
LREVEELLPPPEGAAASVTPLDADTGEAIEPSPPPSELH